MKQKNKQKEELFPLIEVKIEPIKDSNSMGRNNEVEIIYPINNIKFKTIDHEKLTVLASELYQFLELDISNFARWCKENIDTNPYVEQGVDVSSFMTRRKVGATERNFKDFVLSIDFAKKLCMVTKSKKGEEIRNYFIEIEKRFKKAKQIIEKPVSDEELVLKGYQILMRKVETLKKQIEHDKPDVDFAKTVKQSKKWHDIGDIAKELAIPNMGQDNLFKFLADNKYIMADWIVKYKDGKKIEKWDNYRPYQKDVCPNNYFKLVSVPYIKEGQQYDYLKLVCSQKGAKYIRNLLVKHGYIKGTIAS